MPQEVKMPKECKDAVSRMSKGTFTRLKIVVLARTNPARREATKVSSASVDRTEAIVKRTKAIM